MIGHSTERENKQFTERPGDAGSRNSILTGLMFCTLCLVVPGGARAAESIDLSDWAAAEAGTLPESWQLLTFPSIAAATSYEIVQDPVYGPVIWARSQAGAGGIGRSLSIDPASFPILNWSWKIQNTLPRSSLNSESGDDFPVRLMVSFKSAGKNRRGLQDNILCYVWALKEPVGTVAVNPVHRHIKTFVAASGSSRSGSWQEMSRNLVADYRAAFAEEPGTITGVVLMTDTDNTESEAQGWYGPILLRAENEPGSQDLMN